MHAIPPLRAPRSRALLLLPLALVACVPPATIPMRVASRPASGSSTSTSLLVLMLPGRLDRAEVYDTAGLVADARAAGYPADLSLVDAHWGYFRDRTVVERLEVDVIAPARAEGRHLWLIGASAGGFAGLRHAMTYRGHLDGIVAFAPFLGEGPVIAEIERAGGLASWDPGPSAPTDHERLLWTYLKEQSLTRFQSPRLILAIGERDMYARQHRLLAAAMPAEQIVRNDGGHDWRTWRRLFEEVLRRGLLPTQ